MWRCQDAHRESRTGRKCSWRRWLRSNARRGTCSVRICSRAVRLPPDRHRPGRARERSGLASVPESGDYLTVEVDGVSYDAPLTCTRTEGTEPRPLPEVREPSPATFQRYSEPSLMGT